MDVLSITKEQTGSDWCIGGGPVNPQILASKIDTMFMLSQHTFLRTESPMELLLYKLELLLYYMIYIIRMLINTNQNGHDCFFYMFYRSHYISVYIFMLCYVSLQMNMI